MRFAPKCIYCGRYNDSLNYSCSCRDETWFRRYRTSDIDIDLENKKTAIHSTYNNYHLNNSMGLLQYRLLPCRRSAPGAMPTVGGTPLHKLTHFADIEGCDIYLKDEGQNPSSCFKDRESAACLLHNKAENINSVVIYSSGNAAASAALMIANTSGQLVTFVPGDTYREKIDYIRSHGTDVVVIGDKETSFEEGYRLFSDLEATGFFAGHGFDNWSVTNPYRVQGDKTIAIETVKQLSTRTGDAISPDYVVVPTANGSCLTGIWKGFKELHQADIIEKLPKMVSAGIKNASPVYQAVQQHQTTRPVQCDLSKTDKEDLEIGSIILAEEGYDSIEAAKAVIESHGSAFELHASDIRETLIQFLREENNLALKHSVLPEPASVTALAALDKINDKISSASPGTMVCICTGHGFKARHNIDLLLQSKPGLQDTVAEIVSERQDSAFNFSAKKGDVISAGKNLPSIRKAFLTSAKPHHNERA